MGIYCVINLYKSSDGTYAPGSSVSGVIKYALDEETVFKSIIISLNGSGNLILGQKPRNSDGSQVTYIHKEDYVNIYQELIGKTDKEIKLPIGSYETEFSFILPHNIPASLKYLGASPWFDINCKIKYCVEILFVKTSFLSFNKKFEKEINVLTGITPRLRTVPVISGQRKILTQFFCRKQSIVNIKATVKSCVIKRGGTIELDNEVINDTNVTIKGIETKLMEAYTFFRKDGIEVINFEDIPDTDSKTNFLGSGETRIMSVEILVPPDRSSLENSKLVKRDFAVRIIVQLPMPHCDVVLDTIVQVGDTDIDVSSNLQDAPPAYWQEMGKEYIAFNDNASFEPSALDSST